MHFTRLCGHFQYKKTKDLPFFSYVKINHEDEVCLLYLSMVTEKINALEIILVFDDVIHSIF